MFKKVVAMIMAIALVVAGIQFTPATVDAAVNSAGGSSSWKLVWNDEFNQTVGGTPDTSVMTQDMEITDGEILKCRITHPARRMFILQMSPQTVVPPMEELWQLKR